MKPLRELIYDLEDEVVKIGAKAETLEDVEILLGRLVEDMDRTVHKGEEKLYFNEYHRKLRIYSNLIEYLVRDFKEDCEKANEIKEELFNQVVKNGVHEKTA